MEKGPEQTEIRELKNETRKTKKLRVQGFTWKQRDDAAATSEENPVAVGEDKTIATTLPLNLLLLIQFIGRLI